MNPSRAHSSRWKAGAVRLIGLCLSTLLLTSCGTVLWETEQDMLVYFGNTTDQTLYLRLREFAGRKDLYLGKIDPAGRTLLEVIDRGTCADYWVITDENAKIVKDPGQICWHQTVTIP